MRWLLFVALAGCAATPRERWEREHVHCRVTGYHTYVPKDLTESVTEAVWKCDTT